MIIFLSHVLKDLQEMNLSQCNVWKELKMNIHLSID